MNTRPLVGSSWTGSGSALIIPTPPTEPGTPPVDPPVDPDVTGLVNRLMTGSRTLALWHHGEASGNAIPDLRGNFPGTITTGQTIRLQPALSFGDPSRNSTLYVNGYSTVPGDLAQARPDGGGCIIVFQFQPSARWMSLINRFGASWANPGGFALAIAYTGGAYKLRGQLHDGTSTIVLEAATALVPGTSYAADLIWGPDGLGLYVGNASAAAKVGSNATMVGSQGAYPIVIGADRAGASLFAGAIDLVALYDGQPSEASVLLDLAEVKAGVVWANDGAITLQASTAAVFDPRPTALVDSTSPTAVVTVQPSNATATAQVGGTISVVAGASAGASTNGRFTLDGSPAAQLSVTVTAAPPPAPSGSLHRTPFNSNSAIHIPIGSGANFESTSDPATNDMINLAGIVIPNRDASSASYPWGGAFSIEAVSGDSSYTVTAAPGETSFGEIPVTLKIPEVVKTLTATTGDRTVCITAPDGVTQYNFYHFRWDGSKFVAGGCRSYRLDGLGHGTAADQRVGTSASGMAQFGTFYRPEWYHDKSFVVPSMIHVVLPRCATYNKGLSKVAQLPATTLDGGWATINSGHIPYGAVFSMVEGFNLNSIGLSADGKRTLGQPIYDYGLIAVDGRGCTSYGSLRATSGTEAYQNLPEAAAATLASDLEKIRPHLRMITNGVWFNGQTVRGGGTPRAPNRAIV